MPDTERGASVIGIRDQTFIRRERLNAQGLWETYGVTETVREAARLGADVHAALAAPWPDIAPAWPELIQTLLKWTGVTSERRFVAQSTMASVYEAHKSIAVRPMKPDGRSGYSGVANAPIYELTAPTDRDLGDCILRALRDSGAFPDRPTVR